MLSLQEEELQEKINLLSNDFKQSNSLVKSLNHKIQRYNSLKGLTETLGSSLVLDDIARFLVNEAFNLLYKKGNVCILFLFDQESKELGILATKKEDQSAPIKSKIGDIFDHWVLVKMQPLIIEDAEKDFRFDLEKIPQKDIRGFRSMISSPLSSGKTMLGVLRIDNPHPGVFNSEDLRFLSTISDLGAMALENAMLYQRTRELAIRDDLTSLYLRRYFFHQLNQEIIRAVRKKSEVSLIILDIDKFKSYNDKYGHIAGDIVLKTVGNILNSFFSEPGNLVCRYGGEEFAVLLPDIPKAKAVHLADELRKKIKDFDIFLRKKKTNITVSMGVASFPSDARTKEEFILKADMQLLKAKDSGRDKVCCS
ncbi:MAG: sensor domain-containing diguanylate cyclase [Candidatus Omnitrophica bacterium]|nr:sensor domain-containing diguanylate cyclase [Candidatus Omnitrophota bacterium]HOX54702.1 sensor domain-containing diguanylate cyclase [Candidatus Omnitrophota bacterium]